MKTGWIHLYAWLVAVGALILVLSGAFVANQVAKPDATPVPALFSRVGHPALAGPVGLLAIGLAIWLLATEKRSGLRRAGWLLVAGVVAEAALGMLAGPASAAGMGHAFLAPLVFSTIVAIAWGTLPACQAEPQYLQDKGWPPLRSLGRNTAVLAVIQVALGVAFRYGALGVMPHVLGALLLVVFILALVVLVTMMPEHPTLRPAAITLGVLTFVQVFLGLTVISLGSERATRVAVVALGAAHVAIGALTLAATIVVAMEIRRCVLPAPSEEALAG